MLGEKLGELQGKVTGQRVLSSEGSGPKMETSFEIRGAILGVEAAMLGTYWSTVRPDGSLYGECPMQGILRPSAPFRQPSKKWTCSRSMARATSRRHIFEANANRFSLIPQVHRSEPCDHLRQQASIRDR